MLVVYVDDFKLSGPTANLSQGWKLLRKYISIEQEIRVDEKGSTYLGCRQVRRNQRLPHGGMATVMEYDMEEFVTSCVDKYKELAGVRDVRPVPTPFINEDPRVSPAGAPASPGSWG